MWYWWWSKLKFEKNCVPPEDVNSHNLGFVYLEASVNVYSTEEYVSRMLILQRRSDRGLLLLPMMIMITRNKLNVIKKLTRLLLKITS